MPRENAQFIGDAAVRGSLHHIYVYASGGTGSILQRTQHGPGQWGAWTDPGPGPSGHALGRPAAASWALGHIDLFAVDQVTGHLLHKSHDGGVWSPWIDRGLGPGGHRVADPAAVSWGRDRVDVVARTPAGRLRHHDRPAEPCSRLVRPGVEAPGGAGHGAGPTSDRGHGGHLVRRPAAGRVHHRGVHRRPAAHTWFDGMWHNLERLHVVRAPIITP